MIRHLAVAALGAMAVLVLAGCAGGGTVPAGAPYDFEANPYCGVYGTCEASPARQPRPSDFSSGGW
jgi:hypothetical protein